MSHKKTNFQNCEKIVFSVLGGAQRAMVNSKPINRKTHMTASSILLFLILFSVNVTKRHRPQISLSITQRLASGRKILALSWPLTSQNSYKCLVRKPEEDTTLGRCRHKLRHSCEDNEMNLKESGCEVPGGLSGLEQDLLASSCVHCNELSRSTNDGEVPDYVTYCQLPKDSVAWN
jgi:hypothetical protein